MCTLVYRELNARAVKEESTGILKASLSSGQATKHGAITWLARKLVDGDFRALFLVFACQMYIFFQENMLESIGGVLSESNDDSDIDAELIGEHH